MERTGEGVVSESGTSARSPFGMTLSKSQSNSSWGNGQELIDSVYTVNKKKKKKKW